MSGTKRVERAGKRVRSWGSLDKKIRVCVQSVHYTVRLA